MPSDQSPEKSSLLLKLGAAVERVTPAPIVDRNHFVNLARTRAQTHTHSLDIPGHGYFADQFENPENWQAHYAGTGPEIYAQCGEKLDVFVAGAGTGGTLAGVARFLKPKLTDIKIVLADPPGSGLYNRVRYGVMFDPKEREGTRRRQQVDTIVEGIGINRVTSNFEAGRTLVDDAVRVTDKEAMAMAKFLVEKEGLFLGSSSAVNCVAAVRTALKMGPGKRIVTILCDGGQRHLGKFWKEIGDVGEGGKMTVEDVMTAEDWWGKRREEGRERVEM
jgi:cysteine synthase A